MIRAAAGISLAIFMATAAFACGGSDKPPLTPDGPDMTQPVGDDAGYSMPPSPAAVEPPSVPGSPKGGIETQTTIGH